MDLSIVFNSFYFTSISYILAVSVTAEGCFPVKVGFAEVGMTLVNADAATAYCRIVGVRFFSCQEEYHGAVKNSKGIFNSSKIRYSSYIS